MGREGPRDVERGTRSRRTVHAEMAPAAEPRPRRRSARAGRARAARRRARAAARRVSRRGAAGHPHARHPRQGAARRRAQRALDPALPGRRASTVASASSCCAGRAPTPSQPSRNGTPAPTGSSSARDLRAIGAHTPGPSHAACLAGAAAWQPRSSAASTTSGSSEPPSR